MPVPPEVIELVERFDQYYSKYTSPTYNETQVRREFIDPLFEAKKPAVNLKENPKPAYQLRRYAWSAKLPISILTDFEEFIVFGCTKKPHLPINLL